MKLCLVFLILAIVLFTQYPQVFAGIQEAEVAFLNGDYNIAIAECNTVVNSADYASRAKAYFLKGQSHLKQDQTRQARESFQSVLREFATNQFCDDAQLGLGDTFFAEGDFNAAIREYEIMRQRYPNGSLNAIALYKIARCYDKSGKSKEADFYYQILRQNYPLSFEARLVDSSERQHYYTVQVGSFSQRRNAERLLNSLKDKNFDGYIDKEEGFYKVRVGRFQSKEELDKILNKLKNSGYKTRIISVHI